MKLFQAKEKFFEQITSCQKAILLYPDASFSPAAERELKEQFNPKNLPFPQCEILSLKKFAQRILNYEQKRLQKIVFPERSLNLLEKISLYSSVCQNLHQANEKIRLGQKFNQLNLGLEDWQELIKFYESNAGHDFSFWTQEILHYLGALSRTPNDSYYDDWDFIKKASLVLKQSASEHINWPEALQQNLSSLEQISFFLVAPELCAHSEKLFIKEVQNKLKLECFNLQTEINKDSLLDKIKSLEAIKTADRPEFAYIWARLQDPIQASKVLARISVPKTIKHFSPVYSELIGAPKNTYELLEQLSQSFELNENSVNFIENLSPESRLDLIEILFDQKKYWQQKDSYQSSRLSAKGSQRLLHLNDWLSSHHQQHALILNTKKITEALEHKELSGRFQSSLPIKLSIALEHFDAQILSEEELFFYNLNSFLEDSDPAKRFIVHQAKSSFHKKDFHAIKYPQSKLPKHLSPSSLERYLSCPAKFKYSSIEKLKDVREEETIELDPLAKGSWLHKVLEILGSQKSWPHNSQAEIQAALKTTQAKYFAGSSENYLLYLNSYQDFYTQKIFEHLNNFEIALRNILNKQVQSFREKNIELKLDQCNLPLKAFIDRIDIDELGQCFVWDYKSGGTFAKKLSTQIDNNKLQLPLYWQLIEKAILEQKTDYLKSSSKLCGGGYINILEPNRSIIYILESSEIAQSLKNKFSFMNAQIIKTKDWLELSKNLNLKHRQTEEAILNSNFKAQPANNLACDYCDFRAICAHPTFAKELRT